MAAPQFQHCSNGPSTISWQARQTQCRCTRMAQLVEQRARALELVVVGDPDLGQGLVGRQFAGDAAGVHALHGRGDAGVRSMSAHSVAMARLGARVSRFIGGSGTIAHLRRSETYHDDDHVSPTIRIDKHGGPEEMQLVDVPVGDPGPGEIRIRHQASGLNFIDVYQRSGVYSLPMPLALGKEGAGMVEAVGEGVTHLPAGDRAAYCGGPPGSYSLARVMPAKTVVKLPDAIEFETGAAMMLKGLTAQYLLQADAAAGRPAGRRLHRSSMPPPAASG